MTDQQQANADPGTLGVPQDAMRRLAELRPGRSSASPAHCSPPTCR
jgi:hypothetical protein